jgi:hypothetical protein
VTNEQREALLKEQDRHLVDEGIVRAVLARVPSGWTLLQKEIDGAAFRRGSIQVIVSVSEYAGDAWVHVSACGRRASGFFLPEWEDMKRVKADFVGDAWAYQALPPEREYVNINPYVLHLWARVDGSAVLPDFTRGLKTI